MKLRLKVLITFAVIFIISAHLLGCHNYDLEKNEPVVYYEPYEYKLGDIRLQFYSDTMFRLEQGKDGAFQKIGHQEQQGQGGSRFQGFTAHLLHQSCG